MQKIINESQYSNLLKGFPFIVFQVFSQLWKNEYQSHALLCYLDYFMEDPTDISEWEKYVVDILSFDPTKVAQGIYI